MADDNGMPPQTTEEIVAAWREQIEGVWETITDDEKLTDDQRAELIQTFEDIDGLLDDAKKILNPSDASE